MTRILILCMGILMFAVHGAEAQRSEDMKKIKFSFDGKDVVVRLRGGGRQIIVFGVWRRHRIC